MNTDIKKCETERIKIAYRHVGEGRPLVLLHGNGEDSSLFAFQLRQLAAAGYEIFAPDSRGHGRTAELNPVCTEFHYKEMAEDVYAFISRLDLKGTALYGHSDGGIIGLLVEILHPGTLSALAISGTNLSPEGLSPDFVEKYSRINRERPDPLLELMLTEPDISPCQLKRVDIPVLVTAGEHDLILPEETELIAKTLPHADLTVFEGEDHGSYIVNSPKMGERLLSFLEDCNY